MESSDYPLLCVCFLTQIFEDAYKSQLSCVVVDDIERLLGEFHTHCLGVFFLLQTPALLIFSTMIHRLCSHWPKILEPCPPITAGFTEESTASCMYPTAQ